MSLGRALRGWRRYFVQASCSSSSGAFCARSGLEGAGCASGTWHREEPSFCSGRAARGGWGAFYSSPRLLSIDADAQESRRTPQSVLNLSDAAIARLRELQKGSDEVLRISVEAGGCSGFQYHFTWVASSKELDPSDMRMEQDGAKVAVDAVSMEFLRGATVDFQDDLMRSAFVITANPHAQSACGCGSSFVAKDA